MKTVLVTGGTNGLGKGIAMNYLKTGDRVVVIGNSLKNGEIFQNEAKKLGAEERAFYLQADLSLVKENKRIIEEIIDRFHSIDILVFSAAKHSKEHTLTKEGVEFTFSLAYLSRFILSYGLKECLEKSENPIILNMCGTGMKGKINWNDLQFKNSFEAQKVMMHGSRLNDLLGAQFVQNDTVHKIKYVMYNPWAVQTPGMMEFFSNPVMRLFYKLIGKPVEKAIIPIIKLLNNPPMSTLSAYREYKVLSINKESYNIQNARRLYDLTTSFLEEFGDE